MGYLNEETSARVNVYLDRQQDFSIFFRNNMFFGRLESFNRIKDSFITKEPSYFLFDNFINDFDSYVNNNPELLNDGYGMHFERLSSCYKGREFIDFEELEKQKLYERQNVNQPEKIIREEVDTSLLPYDYDSNNMDYNDDFSL